MGEESGVEGVGRAARWERLRLVVAAVTAEHGSAGGLCLLRMRPRALGSDRSVRTLTSGLMEMKRSTPLGWLWEEGQGLWTGQRSVRWEGQCKEGAREGWDAFLPF